MKLSFAYYQEVPMSFPHLEKNNLEKLEIFLFISGSSRKKTVNFFGNPQFQLLDKIEKNPPYYIILGLWKLNEVPLETYLMWKMYLMKMKKKLKGTKLIPL